MRKVSVLLVSAAALVWGTAFAQDAAAPAAPGAAPAAPAAQKPPPPPPPPEGYAGSELPEGKMLTDVKKGTQVDLGKFITKPSVIFFFSTTCSACMAEMADLKGLAKFYAGKVDMFAVCIDANPDRLKANEALLNTEGFTFLADPDYDFANAVNINFAPATLVISKDQKIANRIHGYKKGGDGDLKKAIDKVL